MGQRTPPPPDFPGPPFELQPAFRERQDTGGVQLTEFEAMYETLFAEYLEAGEITSEERERLDMAAAALGLDAERVARLESALLAAWEAGIEETLVDADPSTLADRAPPSTAAPADAYGALAIDADGEPITQKRDFGRLPSLHETSDIDDDSPTLARRRSARPPPPPKSENDELHERYEAAQRSGDLDVQFRIAAVLVRRGDAGATEHAVYDTHRARSPIRPARPLNADAWTQHLFHPDEDRIVGEIFAVIASAALIGRVSAMRRDGSLPRLDPTAAQDPITTTVSAVRALAWSAATLGIRTPPIYLAPEIESGFDLLTTAPPSSRIGARMLSGRNAVELAFACGRHVSWYREEHFVCTLVPSVPFLEDLFVAALHLGAPSMPLPDEVADRARIIASALAPCLEAKPIEKLRRLVARFFARGGVANLKRWARAAEWTACRAGLLLCGDLATACDAVEGDARGKERARQLELFWVSDQASALRKLLGIEITI